MDKPANEKLAPQSEDATDEARRAALKKFGRYAVAASTAMLLLAPRHGRAHHRDGHYTPPGWFRNGKAGEGSYE